MDKSIPWTEKYRPVNIEDIVLYKNVRDQINIFLENRENVHLIITGSPGIGKTSTVKCIARKILKEHMAVGYLELNAAEERGAKTISATIPPFCKKMVNFTYPKIILLDEADSMTPKCQHDINFMIKLYGKKTRFIFTCNDSTKMIQEIQSICRIIRYSILSEEQVCQHLSKICEKEQIPCDMAGLSTIYYISDGDMRKSINDLQKTAYTFGEITKSSVLKICKFPDPVEIKKIIDLCFECDLLEANTEMNEIIKKGYVYLDIITVFINVLSVYDIDEGLKLALIGVINQTKIIVSLGLRSKLQLSGMLCRLIKQINSGDI